MPGKSKKCVPKDILKMTYFSEPLIPSLTIPKHYDGHMRLKPFWPFFPTCRYVQPKETLLEDLTKFIVVAVKGISERPRWRQKDSLTRSWSLSKRFRWCLDGGGGGSGWIYYCL